LSNNNRLLKFEFGSDQSKKSTGHGRIVSFQKMSTTAISEAISNVLDPFSDAYDSNQLLAPLYTPSVLSRFTVNCDVMSQCVEAMKVNIDGMGWHLEYVPDEENADAKPSTADKAEKRRLQLLFDYPNARDSWIDIKMAMRADRCLIGYADLEIVRNLADEIAELNYVPASTIRLTPKEQKPTEHIQWIRDGNNWIKLIRYSKFRRFLQLVNGQKVWFKEFGDPRSLNKVTGEYAAADGRWPIGTEATEILHFADDTQNSPYGEPCWISELMNIMGSAEAKKVNYLYFDNKTIPPFIITVAGGTLGDGAVKQLEDYLSQEFKGVDNFHKVLLIEAAPTSNGPVGDEKAAPVKIEVKPMTEFLQQDALFQEYIKNIAKAVREAFRLPSILTGGSDDHRFANAHEAIVITEQQVFQPKRKSFDEKIIRSIFAAMGIRAWKMVSHGTPTADDAQIITAVSSITAAVSVGQAVDFISELMGKEPPKLDEATRNMLLGQFMATYAPSFDPFGGFGDDDSNQPVDKPEKEKQIIAALKQMRKVLTKHSAQARS